MRVIVSMLQVKAGVFEVTVRITFEEGCKYVLLKENKLNLKYTIKYKARRKFFTDTKYGEV